MLTYEGAMKAAIGCTITSFNNTGDVINIGTDKGKIVLFHQQDCCENVYVEDIIGDPVDLIGGVISVFEERIDQEDVEYGSQTWTFYEIRTTKGDITIRWNGSSNGYYSESVTVEFRPTVD